MSQRKAKFRVGCGCLALLALGMIFTAPMTLMGPAVFLDSERKVLARSASPDGKWIGQLEQLIVGGAPNVVVTIRRSWQPDWYLTSCKALSHYGEATASLRWRDSKTLILSPNIGDWDYVPPFRWDGPLKAAPGCEPVAVLVAREEICSMNLPYDDSKVDEYVEARKKAGCDGPT